MTNRRRLMLRQAAAGGGGTTVYVEEDFTATTTGDLTTSNLAVDELSGGWLGAPSQFVYNADGSGVNCTNTGGTRHALVQTDGREDVQVTLTATIKGIANGWQAIEVRGTTTSTFDGALSVGIDGTDPDADLSLFDNFYGNNVLKTWDLSALLTTAPADGDRITLVIRCSGNDIIFYSMQVNGGTVETVNDSYTLTGASATTHGAGSGADYYGIANRVTTTGRFEYFKVESIP